jgi:predicted nucleotidyltransferase
VANWPEFRPGPILRVLAERGVDFVVIGGYAAIAHGSAQLTRDIDICFGPEETNLQLLGEALTELDARLSGVPDDVPFVPDAANLKNVEVLTLITREGRLDVLRPPTGAPTYQALRRHAERYEVDGVPVAVASLEDLIGMKRAAGRDKDRIALEELEVIRRLRRRVKPTAERPSPRARSSASSRRPRGSAR